MTRIERAIAELQEFLETAALPFMFIGGIANLIWGETRATADLDVKIWVETAKEAEAIRLITAHYRPLAPDPVEMVRSLRVLPVQSPEGVRIEFIFAQLPYEQDAIARAVEEPLGAVTVRVCAPEDLVAHKIISQRERDREDVRGVIARSGHRLDRKLLDALVRGFAADLDDPGIWDFYERCWTEKPPGSPS